VPACTREPAFDGLFAARARTSSITCGFLGTGAYAQAEEVPESLPIPLLRSSSNLRRKRLTNNLPELTATYSLSKCHRGFT
jgi:hypothetical protein